MGPEPNLSPCSPGCGSVPVVLGRHGLHWGWNVAASSIAAKMMSAAAVCGGGSLRAAWWPPSSLWV